MDGIKQSIITVTGGDGFLGKFVVERLKQGGYNNIFIPSHKKYNLVDSDAVMRLYKDTRPDIVIHLAGLVGGIGLNNRRPGDLFYNNLMMGVQMMEQGRLTGIQKFIALGSICIYPNSAPIPFKEENIWDGYPPEDVAPYGFAKKMLLVQAQAYRKQYGFNSIFLAPTNLYGPGDHFDLQNSHVIAAVIRKIYDAQKMKRDKITLWGTGNPTRDFLYAGDCADGIVLAMERYDRSDPINLGTGHDISIIELVHLICEFMDFNGEIVWDKTKPDGQMRRCVDSRKAEHEFGFKAKTPIREGIKTTIDWYRQHRTE